MKNIDKRFLRDDIKTYKKKFYLVCSPCYFTIIKTNII